MKNNKLMILLLIFFIMPILVKADMAAPMSSYEIRISNPEGAETYKWNSEAKLYEKTGEKLNYDEVYYVIYEQVIDNELYGDVGKKEIYESGGYSYSNRGMIKL